MNIALFAASSVGYEVAKVFGENKEPLACLVLDAKNTREANLQIVESAGGMAEEKIFYSDSLYESQTLSALQSLDLDLIILAWWPYIIKDNLIRIPRRGCLNFHPSYLPYNRGKHYNFWAIVEEAPFGVSLHWVSEGIDDGDIAFQSRVETSWEDTGETLYHKAQREIIRLFKEKFSEITDGLIPRIPQDLSKGSFHLSKDLDEASKIDLDASYAARLLLNVLRARTFPPHPAAWFIDGGERYEVRVEIRKVPQ
jgi:methionyl-tRNA formyltransferase